ncbi:hypothetical protein L2E82_13791 [Cichorium intybus]|uniref:Uncharacterized protein n=1 Tax=Cichorium intybus TaxID=13427 RepID=A0ACB9EXL8_CICIN|nr:hypothetical protein L2E82_13791 [Cichorium intybus]
MVFVAFWHILITYGFRVSRQKEYAYPLDVHSGGDNRMHPDLSSVGRAEDCSVFMAILRSLVRIRQVGFCFSIFKKELVYEKRKC